MPMLLKKRMKLVEEPKCYDLELVVETLVTSGRVWRPGMVLPQGRSYDWRWTEAKSAKIPTVICQGCSGGLAWWYQAWRFPYVKDTRTDGRRSRRRCCHRLKWPGWRQCFGPRPRHGQPRVQRQGQHLLCLTQAQEECSCSSRPGASRGRFRWQDYLLGAGMF